MRNKESSKPVKVIVFVMLATVIITFVVMNPNQRPDSFSKPYEIDQNNNNTIVSNVKAPPLIANIDSSVGSTNAANAFPDQKYSVVKIVRAAQQPDFSLAVTLDDKTGAYALLEPNRKNLLFIDENASLAWTREMVEEIRLSGASPGFYRGKIDGMFAYGGKLYLEAGNGVYEIDQRNGSITNGGSR